jgi:hypothetical protein
MKSVKENGVKMVTDFPAAKSMKALGICAVCRNQATCTYQRNPLWPVVQCAQFVAYNTFPKNVEDERLSLDKDSVVTFSPARFKKMQRIV